MLVYCAAAVFLSVLFIFLLRNSLRHYRHRARLTDEQRKEEDDWFKWDQQNW